MSSLIPNQIGNCIFFYITGTENSLERKRTKCKSSTLFYKHKCLLLLHFRSDQMRCKIGKCINEKKAKYLTNIYNKLYKETLTLTTT